MWVEFRLDEEELLEAAQKHIQEKMGPQAKVKIESIEYANDEEVLICRGDVDDTPE